MKVCEFCGEKSKYTCPKCLKNYCSVDCYKCVAHLECSEKFYKDCFLEGLKEDGFKLNNKQKVTEMLQKLDTSDNLLSDEYLENAFSSLELGNESEKMWDMLSKEEKSAFIAMHSSQDFSSIIKVWQPWWKQSIPKLIHDENQMENIKTTIPKIHVSQKNLKFSHKKLSTNIPYDIINVLYGYCYVCRFYNGDLYDLLLQSTHALVSISHSLLTQTFDSPHSSIDHCLYNLTKFSSENYFISHDFSLAIVSDVACILNSVNSFNENLYIKAALSQLRSLFKKASQELKSKKEECNSADFALNYKVFKKLTFYLSWLEENSKAFKVMGLAIEIIFHSKLTDLSKKTTEKELIESNMEIIKPKEPKKLIVEL